MSFLTSRQQVAPHGIGKPVRRREDARLLTGAGRFADDTNLPGQAYACLLRSPHAHARIADIATRRAAAAPGVIAVLTGDDAARDGLQPIPHRPVPANPHEVPLKSRDGSPFFIAPHPLLAVGKVRHVGEPVAMVVADTLPQAMDAAERVEVSYDPLPAVVRSADALAPGAPVMWEEHGANLCVNSEAGDGAATELAFAGAAHVVQLKTTINRVTGVPIELRAAVGAYDEAAARYTVYTSAGGGVVRQRDDVAAVLGVPPAAVRVVSGDVGGNFGIRNSTCPEFALVAWAARRVGRPVKWTCDRRDAFATDFHGRDLTSEAELALDKNGRFLAIRAVNTSNLGASAVSFVPLAKGIAVSSSVYDIACSYMRGRAAVTNTAPTSAYRSAGRPEVMFVLERLIDIACSRHGFDRLEIRRRNLVSPAAMPYRNPLGLVYDSGDYPASLQRAAELGDWAGFAARRAEAHWRGRCRGIGIAMSIELNTGAPRERAEITIDPSRVVELVLGTMSAGQGHETSFAQVVGEWLGVEPDQVRRRYDYSTEYVRVMRELWETGRSDFKGDFFQMNDCRLSPRPQAPVKIVCAGQSERGMQFGAEFGEYNFVIGTGVNTPTAHTPTNERMLAAAARTKRDVGTYVLLMVIADETDDAARAKWRHYNDGVDTAALAWMAGQAGADPTATEGSTAKSIVLSEGAINFNMGTLVGSYASVARMLDEAASVPGTKGLMLTFDDFLIGMQQFGQHIQPLMKCRLAERTERRELRDPPIC